MLDSMQRWQARLYDGKTAEPRLVSVVVASGGFVFQETGGAGPVWPYGDLKLTGRSPAQFGHGRETLVASDPAILAAISRANPDALRRMAGGGTSPLHWMAGVLAAFVAALALVWYGLIPAAASGLARMIPVSWEESFGEAVSDSFFQARPECQEPRVSAALEEIVGRLDRAEPSPYRFRVRVARDPAMNALAAPGGYIVVLSGLLARADSPDEVAGVLAHEMEHVRQRHVTRGMLRDLTISVVLGLTFGDADSLATLAANLGRLQFQRGDEARADRAGIGNLAAAGVAPDGLIRFLKKLESESPGLPAVVQYLSTHPATGPRIQALEEMAAEIETRPRPFTFEAQWPALREACR